MGEGEEVGGLRPGDQAGEHIQRMPQRNRGFSLIELIVVIGIIAILIGLLLPTLARVRESAKTVACAAQLRQVGQAILNYAGSNDGMLPAWSGSHSYPNDVRPDDPNGPGWVVLIERFVGAKPDSPLFTCPAWNDQEKAVTYFLAARYCGSQSPPSKSFPLSRIKLSSMFVLSGDVTHEAWYRTPFGTSTSDDFDNIDKDDNMIPCVLFHGEAGGFNLHRAGNNLLFADGHVSPFRRFDPQAITFHPTERKRWDDYGDSNTP